MSALSFGKTLPLILLLGACAESTAAPGAASVPRPVLDEDDLWAMIPAEADLVLWVDMAKLRASPWTRESFTKVAGDASAAESGFDQIRDLDRMVFAKVPSLRDGASVLVAQGKIDRDRMAKAFARAGGANEKSVYRGAEVLLRGENILIATGSSPLRPELFPFGSPEVYDSDTILGLDRLPERLADRSWTRSGRLSEGGMGAPGVPQPVMARVAASAAARATDGAM